MLPQPWWKMSRGHGKVWRSIDKEKKKGDAESQVALTLGSLMVWMWMSTILKQQFPEDRAHNVPAFYLYLSIYIYIFIYPLLSFDLALLCKFSSNTRSGTALGRVGSWTGRIKCSNKSNTELWNWQRPLFDYSGIHVDGVLESQYWRKSFPAKSFLPVALQWQAARCRESTLPKSLWATRWISTCSVAAAL